MHDSSLMTDANRLWASLMDMATIGATKKGGVCRLSLTEMDRQGRDLFVQWCKHAGCSISIDRMGNVFARRAGSDPDANPIVMGSHLDSQPTGGKFDGVYGVLAGLEVIRTLNDYNVTTRRPVEVATWTNEEGVRFAPAMIGSGVFAGAFSHDFGLSREDSDGVSIEQALHNIDYAGEANPHNLGAHIELHIEQGPILEAENKQIGIVRGVQGIRWYDIEVNGTETHAGPNPMELRDDPVLSALPFLQSIYDIALARKPDARVTIGKVTTQPGSRNTVPASLKFTLDMRHPDEDVLDKMDQQLRQIVTSSEKVALEDIWYSPPVAFDSSCLDAIQIAVDALGYTHRNIVSGAGHDSVYISRCAPTAMIFIPCKEGISHNEAESATPSDVHAGANVLLRTVLHLANR